MRRLIGVFVGHTCQKLYFPMMWLIFRAVWSESSSGAFLIAKDAKFLPADHKLDSTVDSAVTVHLGVRWVSFSHDAAHLLHVSWYCF